MDDKVKHTVMLKKRRKHFTPPSDMLQKLHIRDHMTNKFTGPVRHPVCFVAEKNFGCSTRHGIISGVSVVLLARSLPISICFENS